MLSVVNDFALYEKPDRLFCKIREIDRFAFFDRLRGERRDGHPRGGERLLRYTFASAQFSYFLA